MGDKMINKRSVNNPFLTQDLLKQTLYTSVMKSKDSNSPNHRMHAYQAYVDDGPFVKIFFEHFQEVYLSLSVNAKAVIGCFVLKMPKDQDVIFYSKEQLRIDSGLSVNPLGAAINELIDKQLIARVTGNKRSEEFHNYFINAKYFFRGKKSDYYDRVFRVKENVETLIPSRRKRKD